ncbi:MAG TPA: DUF1287 domain-containing protein [Verrucomicrobiales bacterium]|nr:DUF1287 domain-containing protein [Verrucomicrobiales bacterium]HRJ09343.1 DUF1287 domain-containing protein [Prosthecobacter sp.]
MIRFLTLLLLLASCHASQEEQAAASRARLPDDGSFASRLCLAALERTRHQVRYDPAYVRIPYPGGDVPADTGVCTDVVVRSYRALGIDLQKEVHEDMRRAFSAYPKNWGLTAPDTNIDHRRVPNLQTFLKRRGAALPVTQNAADYLPGDLVTCTVAGRLPHIAIVVPAPDDGPEPWIVHNIGQGPRLEKRLFEFPITGHFRWRGK